LRGIVPAQNCEQLRLCPKRRERSEEHTSEFQSLTNFVCRLLLEKKNHSNPPTVHSVRRQPANIAPHTLPVVHGTELAFVYSSVVSSTLLVHGLQSLLALGGVATNAH